MSTEQISEKYLGVVGMSGMSVRQGDTAIAHGSGDVPVLATLSNGAPYSGFASGTRGIADWSGNFVNGKPDGEFRVVLGDRRSVSRRYRDGIAEK